MAKRKRFGEILIEAKVLDEHQLERALEKQKGTGRRLGQVLEEMGVVTERDIAAAVARQFGFKTVSNIAKAKFSQELLALFDSDMALNRLLFPLKKQLRPPRTRSRRSWSALMPCRMRPRPACTPSIPRF